MLRRCATPHLRNTFYISGERSVVTDRKYELYLGDCLEKMKSIPNRSIDMILCDLPYGVTQNKLDIVIPFDALWNEYKELLSSEAVLPYLHKGHSTLSWFSPTVICFVMTLCGIRCWQRGF